MRKKDTDTILSKEILNTREAAALLKVTTQTIKNYIYSGRLQAIKTPGGHHRIRRQDLQSIGFVADDSKGLQSLSRDDLWVAYSGLVGTFIETVQALIKALDMRDILSSGHSARVADMSCAVGTHMGLRDKDLQDLRLAALLHDVGKVGISDAIIGKPGRLTEQEFFLVKKHCEIGEQIVSGVEYLRGVAPIVRHHHEFYDGKGYPDGIGGDDIEFNARIISVADAFDFLRSDLSFRAPLSVSDTLDKLQTSAGTQFDPRVVDAFVDVIRERSHQSH
ncbi:MAG: HD domain-containing protein [Deltaproteobacteria bacterium]|jgi:excisionase family DNA binding protein|nr:HD domain-containing protein [Deltaproteobacteria bacterium]